MNSMTHQCVIEQVRSGIALARELGKPIVVSKQLARAAKEFLEMDICPRSNISCLEARHIGIVCARRALFRDVLQIHNAASVISLRDMARTVFLDAVGSISEACVIVQLLRFIENFTFDSKTTPHGRTFACIDEGCLTLPRLLESTTTTGMSQWGDSTCRALTHYTLMAKVESTHINSLIFRVKSALKIHINFFYPN